MNIFIKYKKTQTNAYTLAETLISLLIIGVVASITMKAIKDNIDNIKYANMAKAQYSRAAQVVEQIRIENNLQDFRQKYGSFVSEFSKYFKTEKIYVNGRHDLLYNISYKTLNGKIAGMNLLDDGEMLVSDGSIWYFENPANSSQLFISVDVNGYKKPNTFGKDLFMFYVDSNGFLMPMGSNDSPLPAKKYCVIHLDANDSAGRNQQGLGCMYYVLNNIKY